MAERILVVEDEPLILRGLRDALGDAGFQVRCATDGAAAVAAVEAETPDLVLLDIMLPKKDGFEVLRAIRKRDLQLPVIMLTARGAEQDRVKGLTLGADDYVTKPFSVREVLARVRAVLRRSSWAGEAPERVRMNGVLVDLSTRTCDRSEVDGGDCGCEDGDGNGDGTIELTVREAELLRYLLSHRDRVVTRGELLTQVWQYPKPDIQTRTVEAHMVALRRKVEPDPASPTTILTARGEGYRLGGEIEELQGP